MKLVIVESPTKAKTLSSFLTKDYQTESTLGHIRDLPKSRLGINVEENFKPQYVVPKKKQKKVRELQEIAARAKDIILATDMDREGEAIAYHVKQLLEKKANVLRFQRIVFHEITKEAILNALKSPRNIDLKLFDAQQTRRILDRLVGYKLSPLLWYKIRKGLSAGRVQSVALRLIAEREREIEAFIPVEYWVIQVELSKMADKAEGFLAKLMQKNDKQIEIKNENEAEDALCALKIAKYSVSQYEEKKLIKNPYPAFTTSTMQQMAANYLRFSAKKAMKLAQDLYEGGFITYHRTDSVSVAKEAIGQLRDFIYKEYGKKYLPEKPIFYKTKSKVAQEAHEAIRPTNIWVKDDIIGAKLNRDAEKLYALIWTRALASQMKPAIYDQKIVLVDTDNGYRLKASGLTLSFDGFRRVFANTRKNDQKGEETKIPSLTVGEKLKFIKATNEQKFTQPPPRFTDASLIKTLEENGIGRPSTYAPIISTIAERQYVERMQRYFIPTSLGLVVNDFLVEYFPNIVDVKFTAKMEDKLDNIANGHLKSLPVIGDFYTPFAQELDRVYQNAKRVKIPSQESDEVCSKCQSKMVIRIGKFGKFLACSKFPDCDFTKAYVEKTEFVCPKCGGEIIVKQTKRGKRFYGCSNYPKCNFAAWRKDQIVGK